MTIKTYYTHILNNTLTLHEETEIEKKAAEKELAEENARRIAWNALNFRVNQASQQEKELVEGRKKPGPKSSYDVFQKGQRLTRGNRDKGGVGWWRYYKLFLENELFPNLLKLKANGRDPVVMEDGAGAHSKASEMWRKRGVKKFKNWPANSPDLNPIEKAWNWCRD